VIKRLPAAETYRPIEKSECPLLDQM
jgi:hypothetical protein